MDLLETPDRRLRLNKRSTLPSSYAFTPKWMKNTTETIRSGSESTTADEPFPSLVNATTSEKKKRSVWSDTATVKKKVSSVDAPVNDPFAGMNACVDYEAEIERLKTLVPKVDAKRRTSPRPKSVVPSQDTKSSRNNWISNNRTVEKYSDKFSDGSSDSSSDGSSEKDLAPIQPPNKETLESSSEKCSQAISEEDKIRFLEFVRNRTSGWNGWESNYQTEIHKTDSLWEEPTPWDSPVYQRQCLQGSLQEKRKNPLVISMPARAGYDLLTSSEPSTPSSCSTQNSFWSWPITCMSSNNMTIDDDLPRQTTSSKLLRSNPSLQEPPGIAGPFYRNEVSFIPHF
ncbi:hypothetical protein J3Q64DRAFT_1829507 [Phycomyces blakesleeanus]|uniref:Uncharacterized protein n=2 Tax=Phycomyces blakesleeanus TaxID=4837 RepID=A0A162YDI1_PHYB8|nr:hypothetical protein PHYBLDRAFT_75789 [Phycomyces blakesleeanus NRRL 1555(-)]OAD80055.1 hypothetical protein PHYBLDRAFT_75789 [Phycomyces blakesleeanus NRRL 1555(-)]|eukprot:XP_018298095.1 hypothetical protein PHYBLDRAFT_75789 [Phycomyces blakesleeanus NRRL 1555(-)]